MNQELLSMLSSITEEEQQLLEGAGGVDRHLYTEMREFTVDSAKMLEKGRLIDIRPHTRFVRFPRHRHNYIEIIYMCQGETTHLIDGNTRVTLRQGELLFLNQHSYHEIYPAGAGDIAVNFIVLPEFFDVAFHMIEKESAIGSFLVGTLRQDDREGQYLHFMVSDVPPVQNLVENMIWSLCNKQENRRRINQYTMGLLFMQLLNHTDRIDESDRNQYENRLVMSVLHYVEECYREASLTRLAQQLNQPVYQLSRLIKMGTGNTFQELLRQKRLSKAAQLLQDTGLPVSDILAAVGYDNSSYFYRIFKEEYGLSPKEYREKNRRAPQART